MERALAWARRFLLSRLFRVGIIGIAGLAIQTAVFELLGIYLRVVSPSTGVLIGGEVSILSIFFLNQKFSFGDRAESGNFFARLAKFHLVIAGSLFLQWALTFGAEHLTANILLIHAAYLAGVGLGFITNYLGYSFFVWRLSGGDTRSRSDRNISEETGPSAAR